MDYYPLHMYKQIIFYGSYLVFPFLILLYYLYTKYTSPKVRGFTIVFCIISLVFIYSRFVEPKFLNFVEHSVVIGPQRESVEPLRIAVFSDVHRGIYTNTVSLKRLVKEINDKNPDLVIIPGDYVYEVPKERIPALLADLKEINAPVFAVTGNHDVGFPGEDVGNEIKAVLKEMNFHVIDNTIEKFDIKGKSITFVGLTDLWEGKADYSLFDKVNKEDFVIAVTHNPDTAFEIQNSEKVDMLVTGHTHGGQIRLPVLFHYAIPTKYDFDKGIYTANNMKVFVTPGVGMVGLPFRFFIPPQVDILTLTFTDQKQDFRIVEKQLK